jgi:exopolysaccharide biosynthesis polyprenyl glycosylphosphotransferase
LGRTIGIGEHGLSEQTAARSLAIADPTTWVGEVAAPSRSDRSWAGLRLLVDVATLVTAGAITQSRWEHPLGTGWPVAIAVLVLGAAAAMGGYRRRLRLRLAGELRSIITATSIACLVVTAVALLVFGHAGTGDATVRFWVAATTLLCAGRIAVHLGHRAARRHGQDVRRTLIVGAGKVGRLTARRLLDNPELGLQPIGFLDKDPLLELEDRDGAALPVLGASWDLERVLAEERVEQVVVAFSTAPHSVLLNIVRSCWSHDVPVGAVPRLYEVEGRRVDIEHLGAMPLIALRSANPAGWQFRVKYALDRVLAAAALVVLSPLLAVIALAVLATGGRPILFRQARVGRDGRSFPILKFRTMRGVPEHDGEANAHWASLVIGVAPPDQAARAEDRRTRVGALLRQFSLDELPQLWNVVRGDMSLVGPRPELPHYVERFRDVVPRYPDRHRVKSGVTGWAQINGLRGETSLLDRVEWDNFYIENWSFWLDLRILARTVPAVLGRRNAG